MDCTVIARRASGVTFSEAAACGINHQPSFAELNDVLDELRNALEAA